jgi:electron transport complex protein RnfB
LALAGLTGREPLPLNGDHGLEAAPSVAFIDEARCIGCTRCLPPCPVDAIVGAPRLMHTVVAELCTGCALCIAPCPVDCIVMMPLLESPLPSLALPDASDSRARFQAHNERVIRRANWRAATLAAKKRGARANPESGK